MPTIFFNQVYNQSIKVKDSLTAVRSPVDSFSATLSKDNKASYCQELATWHRPKNRENDNSIQLRYSNKTL